MNAAFTRQREQQVLVRIAILWREGLDTVAIAERIGLAEHEVANRLEAARGLIRRRAA